MLSASSIITGKYDYEKSLRVIVNRIYHSCLFKATKYCRSAVVVVVSVCSFKLFALSWCQSEFA